MDLEIQCLCLCTQGVCAAVPCSTQVSGFLGQVTGAGVTAPGLDASLPQVPRVVLQECIVQLWNSLPTWDVSCVTAQLEMHRSIRSLALLLLRISMQAPSHSKSSFQAIQTIAVSWVTEHQHLSRMVFVSASQRYPGVSILSKLHVYCSGNNVISEYYCLLN